MIKYIYKMNSGPNLPHVNDYVPLIEEAIAYFWDTRQSQFAKHSVSGTGNRGAVTGGKQLDGFLNLLVKIAEDIGVDTKNIYTKGNTLPGFFRPTKEWDFIIISPSKKLILAIEFKSQVGSFGNNFNNRTEEALGSAVDLWTAFRENGFGQTQPPWVGYLLIVESSIRSTQKVKIKEPYFEVRQEFRETTYLERYALLCQKLMQEQHYSASCLIWTDSQKNFGEVNHDISIMAFLQSYIGFLVGRIEELK